MNKEDIEVGMKVKVKDSPTCTCEKCEKYAGHTVIIKGILTDEILSSGGTFFIRDLERIVPKLPEHLFEI